MAPRTIENKGLDTQSVVSSKMPVCDNITDTAIRITESKARLVYRNHLKTCSGERVISAFGLFVTFLTTLLTASFNDVFGFENSRYVLTAIFIIMAIGSGIATIVFLFQWLIGRKNNNENSFIDALKGYDIPD